jgi:hypothetical protein
MVVDVEPVDDPVEQQRGRVDRLIALLVAPADLGERGTIVDSRFPPSIFPS